MKILYIAPVPPPVTGQSLASKIILDEITKQHEVDVVDFNKGTFKQGVSSLKRIGQVAKILKIIWVKKENADVIYLTISQSLAGNLKDLLTYAICYRKLPRMIIHLHGGGIKKLLFDKYRLIYMMNRYFLKHVGAAVVLGESLMDIFRGLISHENIRVVPNCADDDLFLRKELIREKFEKDNMLRILFLSNLIPGKGHEELVDAYTAMDSRLREKVRVDIAGGFESEVQRKKFLNKIKAVKGLYYHGVVTGAEKKGLFSRAHVFCLPTYYKYEGQPISILEAYAGGCAVLTTDHAGICDIFHPGLSGYLIKKKSSESIREAIEGIAKDRKKVMDIAMYNSNLAEKRFSRSHYVASLTNIINNMMETTDHLNKPGAFDR